MKRALLILVALAAPARAGGLPDPQRWLGVSYVGGSLALRGHADSAFAPGISGGVGVGVVQVGGEYQWMMITHGLADGAGFGQRVALIASVPIETPAYKGMFAGYLAPEATVGAARIDDSAAGHLTEVQESLGARLGVGFSFASEHDSPSSRWDAFFSVRWTRGAATSGTAFGISLQWSD